MAEVKAQVVREVRPREAAMIGALAGQRDAAGHATTTGLWTGRAGES